MNQNQADLFDQLATGSQLYAYAPEALARLQGLLTAKPRRLLDAGCGDGTIGAAFGCEWTVAFDISPRCAALAAGRGLVALVADAQSPLPFAAEAFDTVCCIDMLHHLNREWHSIFSELDRVLECGGTLVIVEPDVRNPFVRWTQAPDSPIRVAPCDDEPAIDPEELFPHLESRGFSYTCNPIHIEGRQIERGVFPLWQRLLKAPFVLALDFIYRKRPNKFAIVAHKPARTCPTVS